MFRAVLCTFLVRWPAERKRRGSLRGSACVVWVVVFRPVGAPRPGVSGGWRSLGSASYKAAPAGRTMHDGRTLRCCVRCSETLLHCALNRSTGSRVAAWTDRASFSVESFGVANGFLRLTCCWVINLVLGVTRSSSRSPYNHAALLSADFEKHVLRLQAQL